MDVIVIVEVIVEHVVLEILAVVVSSRICG